MSAKDDIKNIVESYKQLANEVWNSPATDSNVTAALIPQPEECEGTEEVHVANTNNGETDARMAKSELYKIAKYAQELHSLIKDEENLEPWIFSKITLAGNYLDSVKHYMDYENYRKEDDASCHDSNVIAKLKSMLHGEKREVLEQVMRQVIFNLEMLQTLEETKK